MLRTETHVDFEHVIVQRPVGSAELSRACMKAWSTRADLFTRQDILRQLRLMTLHPAFGLGRCHVHPLSRGGAADSAVFCVTSRQKTLFGDIIENVPPFTLLSSPGKETLMCFDCGKRKGKLCRTASKFPLFRHRRCALCSEVGPCVLCPCEDGFRLASHAIETPTTRALADWLSSFETSAFVIVTCPFETYLAALSDYFAADFAVFKGLSIADIQPIDEWFAHRRGANDGFLSILFWHPSAPAPEAILRQVVGVAVVDSSKDGLDLKSMARVLVSGPTSKTLRVGIFTSGKDEEGPV